MIVISKRKNPTKKQMADMYIKDIDFSIEHNYSSNEFIKECLSEITIQKGLYTDIEIDV